MGIPLHPRYFKVSEANALFGLAICKIEEKNALTMEGMIEAILAIAMETVKVDTIAERKAPDLDELHVGIYKELVALEKTHELTVGESLKTLLGAAMDINKYKIRYERHPDEPGKKGDEA